MRQLDELKDIKNAPARYVDANGDIMTGNLNFNTSLIGLNWSMNTDYAKIYFKNNGDDDTDSYLHFITGDNGNEYFKFSQQGGAATTELMSIKSDGIRFKGNKLSLDGHTHPYIPLSGGTCTGLIQFGSGYSTMGIRFNDAGCTINSTTGEDLVLLKVSGGIRFADVDNWDYNSWAGIKYIHGEKKLYIGGPLGSKLTSNGSPEQIDIDMTHDNSGVGSVYVTNLYSQGKIYTPNSVMGIQLGDDVQIGDSDVANHMVIQGCEDPTMAGITFGKNKDTNIYRAAANKLQTDDTFNAIGGFQFNGQSLDDRYYRVLRNTVSDFNACLSEGQYSFGSGSSIPNAPVSGGTYGVLLVYVNDGGTHNNSSNWIWQDVFTTDGAHFWRYKVNGGAWNPWKREYNTTFKPSPADIGAWSSADVSQGPTANKVVQRDSAGDVQARLLRANYQDENYMNGAIAFRTNNSSDNYTRYCSNPEAVRGWLGFGNWSFNNRDFRCYDKRALVGFATGDGNTLYINYQNDFGGGTWCNGRFHVGSTEKFLDMGVSDHDIAIGHNKTGKWLQLGDDGLLRYADKKVLTEIESSPLWSGYHHMTGNETVTPSKPLSQCNNGWVIVWSDFDDGVGPQNWNFVYTYVPKNTSWKSGQNHDFVMASAETESNIAVKCLYVYDTYLRGNDTNRQGNANDVVMRAVLEY